MSLANSEIGLLEDLASDRVANQNVVKLTRTR